MKDKDFLYWLRDRLVNVYGESELVDFVHKLGALAEAQPPDRDTQWPDQSVKPFDQYPEGDREHPRLGLPPYLDEHLTHEYQCNTPDEFARMVQILLDTNTCFAVIGGENTLRFHDRGAQALGLELSP